MSHNITISKYTHRYASWCMAEHSKPFFCYKSRKGRTFRKYNEIWKTSDFSNLPKKHLSIQLHFIQFLCCSQIFQVLFGHTVDVFRRQYSLFILTVSETSFCSCTPEAGIGLAKDSSCSYGYSDRFFWSTYCTMWQNSCCRHCPFCPFHFRGQICETFGGLCRLSQKPQRGQ